MIAGTGAALWIGGVFLTLLLVIIGAIAVSELARIARALPWPSQQQLILVAAGTVYIVAAAAALVLFRRIGFGHALFPVIVTIATDIGAYFAGRGIGGPKIAPTISPSKTWAGLAGGMIAAGLSAALWASVFPEHGHFAFGSALVFFIVGATLAVVAQVGDFGESFLKRKAGIKDSGDLIPGHGGILDRIDGLLAVLVACLAGWLVLGTVVE